MKRLRNILPLLLLGGLLFGVTFPTRGQTRDTITVVGADVIETVDTSGSSGLENALNQVGARFIFYTAQAVRTLDIPSLPAELATRLEGVAPRFIVYESQAMRHVAIELDEGLPPVLNAVRPRFQLYTAQAAQHSTLSYPLTLINDDTAPQITDVTVGEPTGDSITIEWTTDEFATTLLEYGAAGSPLDNSVGDDDFTKSHSVTLTGLADGMYDYRISGTDLSGNTQVGSVGSFTIQSDVVAPTISNVAVNELSDSSLRVSWTTNEAATSTVAYGTTSGVYTQSVDDATLKTAHQLDITGLAINTTYYLQVQSSDEAGNSAASDELTYTIERDVAGPQITNILIERVGAGAYIVSWRTNAPADSRVEYGTTSNVYTESESSDSLVTSHQLTLTGLADGTTYYLRVVSADASDNVSNSGERTLTTFHRLFIPILTTP